MRPQATFSFFIFLQLLHFFTLLVAPSSLSIFSPRPCCCCCCGNLCCCFCFCCLYLLHAWLLHSIVADGRKKQKKPTQTQAERASELSERDLDHLEGPWSHRKALQIRSLPPSAQGAGLQGPFCRAVHLCRAFGDRKTEKKRKKMKKKEGKIEKEEK